MAASTRSSGTTFETTTEPYSANARSCSSDKDDMGGLPLDVSARGPELCSPAAGPPKKDDRRPADRGRSNDQPHHGRLQRSGVADTGRHEINQRRHDLRDQWSTHGSQNEARDDREDPIGAANAPPRVDALAQLQHE